MRAPRLNEEYPYLRTGLCHWLVTEDRSECIAASAVRGLYAPKDLVDPDRLFTKLALHFL